MVQALLCDTLMREPCVEHEALLLLLCPVCVPLEWWQRRKYLLSLRVKVEKLGAGSNGGVEVKLLDGTKLKGYVSAREQDSFTVTDRKTGASSGGQKFFQTFANVRVGERERMCGSGA